MQELTHDIVWNAYKKDNPLDILMLAFFGLFEWYLPASVLVGSVFTLFSGDGNVWVLSGVLLLLIPFWCLILVRGMLATLLRERWRVRHQQYRIVRAVCVEAIHIVETGDYYDQYSWKFQADDDTITLSNIVVALYSVQEGDTVYLVMAGRHPVFVFSAAEFCTDRYETTIRPPSQANKRNTPAKER